LEHRADGIAKDKGPGSNEYYIDNRGAPALAYPFNPNGSPDGITGLTTPDGRFTIMMPHPERVFLSSQMSWHPAWLAEDSPWMRMFRNARQWVG
jgi:phosphoribosylformylglycinamidine synthase